MLVNGCQKKTVQQCLVTIVPNLSPEWRRYDLQNPYDLEMNSASAHHELES
jgi:hypothetical protein